MGLDIKEMRIYITNAYPGKVWSDKVRHMSDNQVVAIYYSVKKKEKQISEGIEPKTKRSKKSSEYPEGYHQMSLNEFANFNPTTET